MMEEKLKLENPDEGDVGQQPHDLPLMQKIYRKRIKIDPKMIKRFNIKLGEQEYQTYATSRHKYDWTKSEGRNSGWADVEELAESIKKDGIIHTPLVCSFKKFGDGENGEIFAVQGWRRIRAAVLNKQEYIDVDYTEDLTPEEAETLSFKENYNRKNLTDTEISQFLWKIKQRHPDWTYQKIGETYGIGGKTQKAKEKQ